MDLKQKLNSKMSLSIYLVILFFTFLIYSIPTTSAERKINLLYCVDTDWMPYEGIQDGKHIGISLGYLQLIAKYSNINFQLMLTKSWEESLEKLQAGECEATPLLNRTPERDLFLEFSKVYFESPNVIVSTKEQPFLQGFEHIGERTLAIPKSYRLVGYVKRNYPRINVTLVENELEGLTKVSQGKIDLFVGSMLSVSNRILDKELDNLKVAGWAGPEDKLRFGVIKSKKDLIPIINQSLSQITEMEHNSILSKWNKTTVIKHTDYSLAWKILLIAIGALAFMLWRHREIKKFSHQLQIKNVELQRLKIKLETTNQQLKFLSTHDPLTKLYNRNYMNSTIFGDLRTEESSMVCLIVVDIDNFKGVNDTYGHSVGDEILKDFSNILSSTVREYDIVARWGGEEFVIICHQSRKADAEILCKRIMEYLKQHHFPKVERITASFGVAQLREDESIMQCFDRADKALYLAKEKGRDQICCV